MSEIISVTGRFRQRNQVKRTAEALEAQDIRAILPDFEAQSQAATMGDMALSAAYFDQQIEYIRQADALVVADSFENVQGYDNTVAIPSILGEMAAARVLGKPILLQHGKPRDQRLFAALSLTDPIVLRGDLSNIRQYLLDPPRGRVAPYHRRRHDAHRR